MIKSESEIRSMTWGLWR